jgi:hypothetical protein
MNETTLQASEDELAIRAAWVELNAAHVNRDLNMTVKYWLPEVNTIGGGGGLWAGLEQNIQGFSKIFQDPSFVFGLRTPNNIEVATGGPKEAAETGVWTWQETVKNQEVTYSGRYLVMWQLVNGKWSIRSDLYLTTGLQQRN